MHLGIGTAAVRDGWGMQGAINYSELGNPREISQTLHSLGVTHVLFDASTRQLNRFADDVAFFRFAQVALKPLQLPTGMKVAPLPKDELAVSGPTPVAVLGCTAERMTTNQLNDRWLALYSAACDKPEPVDLAAKLATAEVVVIDARRYPGIPAEVIGSFAVILVRDGFQAWGRVR